MSILKIILVPLSLILSLFVWLCAGLLSCSGFVFKLASGLLSLLAIAVMITYSVKNGIILLVLAFLISPMGLVFFGSCSICLYLSGRKNIFNKTIILGYISTFM